MTGMCVYNDMSNMLLCILYTVCMVRGKNLRFLLHFNLIYYNVISKLGLALSTIVPQSFVDSHSAHTSFHVFRVLLGEHESGSVLQNKTTVH